MYLVKLAFSRLRIPDKIQKGYSVLGKMEGNALFPDPSPALAEVRAAIEALEAAHQDALDGGRSKKVAMRTRAAELNELMVALGAYVQQASRGDREAILSAGLEVRNLSFTSRAAEAPAGLAIRTGSFEGELLLQWTGQTTARMYAAEISHDGGSTWTPCGMSSRGRLSVAGLEPGTKPWFRVSAMGPLGQSAWSEAVQAKVF